MSNPATQAESALRRSAYPALRRLSCQYQGNVLMLKGRLPSFYLKQLAQTIALRHLSENASIDNRVEVNSDR